MRCLYSASTDQLHADIPAVSLKARCSCLFTSLSLYPISKACVTSWHGFFFHSSLVLCCVVCHPNHLLLSTIRETEVFFFLDLSMTARHLILENISAPGAKSEQKAKVLHLPGFFPKPQKITIVLRLEKKNDSGLHHLYRHHVIMIKFFELTFFSEFSRVFQVSYITHNAVPPADSGAVGLIPGCMPVTRKWCGRALFSPSSSLTYSSPLLC